jgi:hypothetical protein
MIDTIVDAMPCQIGLRLAQVVLCCPFSIRLNLFFFTQMTGEIVDYSQSELMELVIGLIERPFQVRVTTKSKNKGYEYM